MKKINVWSFCLALGIIWAAGTLLAGWFAALGWGGMYVRILGSVYIGYAPDFWGGILGAVWAFFDGAIFGLALGWLYNKLSIKTAKTKKRPAKKAAKKR